MAENNMNSGMPETNITALKEALCAQQQLLQKLYAELDVERESSSTAVSEALSMILRLQGEKSALMMEASQYKRMSEEEIHHAEETLAIYEDMMYQKEMEISALEFQVQAYKCKLLSLGCADLSDSEHRYQENISLLKNDAFTEMGSKANVRKLKSLPAITRQRSLNASDKIVRIMEEKADEEGNDESLILRKNSGKSAVGGDFESYWEQIRRLDEKVKEISDYKDGGRDSTNLKEGVSRSSSLFSHLSSSTSCDPRRYEIATILDQLKDSKSAPERKEVAGRTSCVYDIYEVRDITEDCKSCTNEEKRQKKLVWEGENRLGKPDPVVEEVFESHIKEETECVKPMLLSAKQEKRLCNTRDESVKFKLAHVQQKVDVAECHESDFQNLSQRIERLEAERNSTSQEIVREGGEDQLNLLREIHEQLNSIKCEMRSLKAEKSSQREDSCLVSLKEALLHFWL
ncbi:hypothetical protein ACOSP7_012586 [Xanthoceras sorbifolium]